MDRSFTKPVLWRRYALIWALLISLASEGLASETKEVHSENGFPIHIGLSTHFGNWNDWRKAISSVMDRPDIGIINEVGVSAGRPEWVYFKWKRREKNWSSQQKRASDDLLETAVSSFHKSGIQVAAIVDVFGPKYIKEHPDAAAVRFDGQKNAEQLSFMEVMEGEYGRMILEMIGYICRNYQVDSVNLTEMSYYSYSYGPEDLRSYEAFIGRSGWPKTSSGSIDREDHTIWEWRSAYMEGFIQKAAEIAHRDKKKLYVDVPVSWKDFRHQGRDSGLDYRRVLRHADSIIVWNYFTLEDLPPSVSEPLSRYLTSSLPDDSFYVSLGLWGSKDPIDPKTFREAVKNAVKGGAKKIWITPDSLMTEEHWNNLLSLLKERGQINPTDARVPQNP